MNKFPDHYSLVEHGEKHFTIHDARDNKTFKVAKAGLHPAHQVSILGLKKYAQGGDIEDDTDAKEVNDTVGSDYFSKDDADTDQEVQGNEAFANQVTGNVPPLVVPTAVTPAPAQAQAGWHAPMLPGDQQQTTPSDGSGEMPTAAAPSAQAQANTYTMPGLAQQEKAAQIQAGVAGDLGKAQEAALTDYKNQMERFQRGADNERARLDDEQAQLQKSITEGKIDPKHYFNNMDTTHRVMTAIGLILGGIGSGLTKGPNVALQMMDKAIDRDIDAQKAELGKKQNLLSINFQKYHNLQAAEAATRLHYNTILSTQLQAAQAKSQSPLAQAALQSKLGQLQQLDQNYKIELMKAGGWASALGATTGGEGGVPVGKEPPMLLMDPKYRENRVIVDGTAYQASGKTEAEQLRRIQSIAEPVKNQINELRSLAQTSSTRFAGTPENNKAHAIMANLAVQLPQLSGLTRINETEINHLLQSFNDPTRLDQAFGDVRSQQTLKNIEDDLETKRSNMLVGYKPKAAAVKSFQPVGQSVPVPINTKRVK